MPRAALLLLLSSAVLAQRPPEVAARIRAPLRVSEAALTLAPEDHTCLAALLPEPWRDPSDALFFASGPTARLDEQELWAGGLTGLVSLHLTSSSLHLFVLGSPVRAGLQFSRAGWRPRWPFC